MSESVWQDPAWRGSGSGPISEAVDFAREIAADFTERVTVRIDPPLDGFGRRTNDGTRLLWTVYAQPTAPTEGTTERDAT